MRKTENKDNDIERFFLVLLAPIVLSFMFMGYHAYSVNKKQATPITACGMVSYRFDKCGLGHIVTIGDQEFVNVANPDAIRGYEGKYVRVILRYRSVCGKGGGRSIHTITSIALAKAPLKREALFYFPKINSNFLLAHKASLLTFLSARKVTKELSAGQNFKRIFKSVR